MRNPFGFAQGMLVAHAVIFLNALPPGSGGFFPLLWLFLDPLV